MRKQLLNCFMQKFKKIEKNFTDVEFEIIFINDGSRDKTLELMRELSKNDDVRYVFIFTQFW